jgi:glycyl-tRNA synthetase
MANAWDYGPLGVELKNNVKQLWWDRFVHKREDIVGIDAALIMNPKVWEASGHLQNFTDPLVECKNCHKRFRGDQFKEFREHLNPNQNTAVKSESWEVFLCSDGRPHKLENLTEEKKFNLMFKTFVGPAEEQANVAYLRPETAQGMFVDFKNVLDTTRKSLPFGIAQVGKAFRNEVTPGNFIFRTREFEQMEIEYFIPIPKADTDWQNYFEHWREEMLAWIKEIGLELSHVHEYEVPDKDRAHYSKRTTDFMFDFPFGTEELYGLAYRTDFDLKSHQEKSGQNLEYADIAGERYIPHVIEPTWGVDRSVLSILCESHNEDTSGKERIYLKIPPKLAPYKVAVFPLLANKPELVKKAREIYNNLKADFMVAWDDRGNIGKRYFAQDEIGTPWCVTVDFQTLGDNTVTIRDRDTTEQIREKVDKLEEWFQNKLK